VIEVAGSARVLGTVSFSGCGAFGVGYTGSSGSGSRSATAAGVP